MNTKNKTYFAAVVGLMTAFAFVSNYFSIQLGDVTRIHLGNGFCILSGFLLGPLSGGLAAGLGGFFYDLTNPVYAAEAPITFLLKFALGASAGWIFSLKAQQQNRVRMLLAAVSSSVLYIALYLGKNFIMQYYLLHNPIETVAVKLLTKLAASATNAVAAVIVSMVLLPVFAAAMKKSGIYDKLYPKKTEADPAPLEG